MRYTCITWAMVIIITCIEHLKGPERGLFFPAVVVVSPKPHMPVPPLEWRGLIGLGGQARRPLGEIDPCRVVVIDCGAHSIVVAHALQPGREERHDRLGCRVTQDVH